MSLDRVDPIEEAQQVLDRANAKLKVEELVWDIDHLTGHLEQFAYALMSIEPKPTCALLCLRGMTGWAERLSSALRRLDASLEAPA